MIRLTILPRKNQPYGEFAKNDEATLFVEWPDGSRQDFVMYIRAFEPNWGANSIARIEGYTELPTGTYLVLGYCQLESIDAPLGILEIQGA